MKKIYEFVLPKEEEVEESSSETKDGKKVTTTTKVKKHVDRNYFLRKPYRKLFDEAELYYAVKLSEGIKHGLLTRALLQKRFSNDGGVLSEEEREVWNELYNEVFEKQVEIQALSLKTHDQRTSEENLKYEAANEWLKDARRRIQEFELNQSALYDQTAENRARNKTILWWVLHLSYADEGDSKYTPFFGPGSFEDKLNKYDLYEEGEDEFLAEVIQKFFYYVSFWYVSKTNSPEEFNQMLKFAEEQETETIEPLEPTEVAFEEPTEEELQEAEGHVQEVVESKKEQPKKRKPKKTKKKKPEPKAEDIEGEKAEEK